MIQGLCMKFIHVILIFLSLRTSMSFEIHIAPMQGYTDMHMRYFIRLILPTATLWTEMLKPKELFHASSYQKSSLLTRGLEKEFDQPCVLQFGSDSHEDLYNAVRLAQPYGYKRYDLNCGCPSTELNAPFGASLMKKPVEVSYLLHRMSEAVSHEVPVSVKCRIGVHDSYCSMNDDKYDNLFEFCYEVTKSGLVKDICIHARSAVLQGLSPSKNREIPPLRKDFVMRIAKDFPHVRVVYNGGISSNEALNELKASDDLAGCMIGRWALRSPFHLMFNESNCLLKRKTVIDSYSKYAESMFCTLNRNEFSPVLLPMALLAYSLEREAVESNGEDEINICYETSWYLMDKIVSLVDLLMVDSNKLDLHLSFGSSAKVLSSVPPYKKFRKFLGDLCGKKIIAKMKVNCNEKYE